MAQARYNWYRQAGGDQRFFWRSSVVGRPQRLAPRGTNLTGAMALLSRSRELAPAKAAPKLVLRAKAAPGATLIEKNVSGGEARAKAAAAPSKRGQEARTPVPLASSAAGASAARPSGRLRAIPQVGATTARRAQSADPFADLSEGDTGLTPRVTAAQRAAAVTPGGARESGSEIGAADECSALRAALKAQQAELLELRRQRVITLRADLAAREKATGGRVAAAPTAAPASRFTFAPPLSRTDTEMVRRRAAELERQQQRTEDEQRVENLKERFEAEHKRPMTYDEHRKLFLWVDR